MFLPQIFMIIQSCKCIIKINNCIFFFGCHPFSSIMISKIILFTDTKNVFNWLKKIFFCTKILWLSKADEVSKKLTFLLLTYCFYYSILISKMISSTDLSTYRKYFSSFYGYFLKDYLSKSNVFQPLLSTNVLNENLIQFSRKVLNKFAFLKTIIIIYKCFKSKSDSVHSSISK